VIRRAQSDVARARRRRAHQAVDPRVAPERTRSAGVDGVGLELDPQAAAVVARERDSGRRRLGAARAGQDQGDEDQGAAGHGTSGGRASIAGRRLDPPLSRPLSSREMFTDRSLVSLAVAALVLAGCRCADPDLGASSFPCDAGVECPSGYCIQGWCAPVSDGGHPIGLDARVAPDAEQPGLDAGVPDLDVGVGQDAAGAGLDAAREADGGTTPGCLTGEVWCDGGCVKGTECSGPDAGLVCVRPSQACASTPTRCSQCCTDSDCQQIGQTTTSHCDQGACCGNEGEPCCSASFGPACPAGGRCLYGTCSSCGMAAGSSCCRDGTCADPSLACDTSDNQCLACGADGVLCCPGNTCNSTTSCCVQVDATGVHKCIVDGALCPGMAHGEACTGGSCGAASLSPCGAANQGCCSATFDATPGQNYFECTSNNTCCIASNCVQCLPTACGTAGKPCCPGGFCTPGNCCDLGGGTCVAGGNACISTGANCKDSGRCGCGGPQQACCPSSAGGGGFCDFGLSCVMSSCQ
jgi:hypothetical protein